MAEPTPELRTELVELIFEITATDGVPVSTFDDESACVGEGLLQDSLDVLEFLVALDKTYGVAIRDSDSGHEMLQNLGTLTSYVAEHRIR